MEELRRAFETLGLPMDASPQKVLSAWRRFALRTHPDRPTGDQETFIIGHAAYVRALAHASARAGAGGNQAPHRASATKRGPRRPPDAPALVWLATAGGLVRATATLGHTPPTESEFDPPPSPSLPRPGGLRHRGWRRRPAVAAASTLLVIGVLASTFVAGSRWAISTGVGAASDPANDSGTGGGAPVGSVTSVPISPAETPTTPVVTTTTAGAAPPISSGASTGPGPENAGGGRDSQVAGSPFAPPTPSAAAHGSGTDGPGAGAAETTPTAGVAPPSGPFGISASPRRVDDSAGERTTIRIVGLVPDELVDIEIDHGDPGRSGVCPKFSGVADCTLISTDGGRADAAGRFTLTMFADYYIEVPVQTYTVYAKARDRPPVVSTTFTVTASRNPG